MNEIYRLFKNKSLEEQKKGDKMRYILTIKPALEPEERHKIQDKLTELGYEVLGGGTCTDMSRCDISFEKKAG